MRRSIRALRRTVAEPVASAAEERPALPRYAPASPSHRGLARLGFNALIVIASGLGAIRLDHLYQSLGGGHESIATVGLATAQAPGTLVRVVLPAETAAWHQSTVYAPVDGAVERWWVDIGDVVHQGQLLCVIRSPAIEAELAASRAQLRASQAQLWVNRADAEFARTTYERWRDSPLGVVSQQERDAKQAEYLGATARLTSAEARLLIDQQRLAHEIALSRLGQVTAPLSGVITARQIDINQAVSASAAGSPTALYQIAQRDPIRIMARVPQGLALQLGKPGLSAEVWVPESDTDRLRLYRGTVARAAGALDRDRTLLIEVDLPNPAHQILVGMLAQMAFHVPPRGTVTVPEASVIKGSDGAQIAQIDASHHVHLRHVTVARDDGDVVELSSGLSAGELIAEHASRELRDGEPVTIRRRQPSLQPTVARATPER